MLDQTARTILLVDDESGQRALIDQTLRRAGYVTRQAADGRAAATLLLGPEGRDIDAVVLDHQMPDMTGIEVLEAVRPRRPALPMLMLTGQSSIATAVHAMRAGATDYLIKPASPDRLLQALRTALSPLGAGHELQPLTEKLPPADLGFGSIVGRAPAFRAALAVAAKAARSAVPVLIDGESGVGKEVVAQAIHAASPRAGRPLVVVNCGAIPANLVESVLFGHEKGAFTGAVAAHVGRFGEADNGTLFLDEIGELPLDAQVKLLRALQTGQIEPVGGRGAVTVNVRIIAATNRDLAREVAAGRFREDLFYRLNVVPLTIPPLRDRREDIPALARAFLARIAEEDGGRSKTLDAAAIDLLQRYDWPGNVRQLQNALFRAAVLCEGDTLGVADFPQVLNQTQRLDGRAPDPTPAAPGAGALVPLLGADGHVRPLEDIEAEVLRQAIGFYRGRMTEVARRLKIGRSTLYRKLGELGLET